MDSGSRADSVKEIETPVEKSPPGAAPCSHAEASPSLERRASPTPFSSFRKGLVVALVLLAFAVLIVRVQHGLCSIASEHVFELFLRGQLGPVFSSRVLMRLLIPIFWAVAPNAWYPEQANTLLQILFCWAGLSATYCFARRWLSWGAALGTSYLTGAWLLWGMLPMGYSFAYPYDLPAFAFSALGLVVLHRRDFWGFFGILFFGLLCKETLGWLLVVAALYEWQNRGRHFGWLSLSALGLAAIGCYLAPRLGHWGGSAVPFVTVDPWENRQAQISRVVANLRELAFLSHGSATENVYWFAALFLPVVYAWRRGLPAFVRCCWGGAFFLFVGNFLFGNLWEVRIFNEVVPVGAFTLFWAVGAALRGDTSESFAEADSR